MLTPREAPPPARAALRSAHWAAHASRWDGMGDGEVSSQRIGATSNQMRAPRSRYSIILDDVVHDCTTTVD